MNPYMEKLKAYLHERPLKYGYDDMGSLIELLCCIYTESNTVDNAVIHYRFMELECMTQRLTADESDQLLDIVCALCEEYTRRAFREGVHVGAQLAVELSQQYPL